MKKSFLMMAMVAMVFASCRKEQAPVPTTGDEDNSPVAVKLFTGAPSIQVKSAGPVGGLAGSETETNTWNGEQLYIYSYEVDATDYTVTPFISNVGVIATTSENNVTALDVKNPATTDEPFYYTAGKKYDFFGYYVDDAAGETPAPEVTKTAVTVPVTINGGQDIMYATTDKQADIDAKTDTRPVTLDEVYSAFSARRDVTPNLLFEHALTRFNFNVIAGSDATKNIEITGLSVYSRNEADLVVVAQTEDARGLKDPDTEADFADIDAEDASLVPLALMQKDEDGTLVPFEKVTFDDVWPDAPVTNANRDETKKSIGNMMVIPGQSEYKLVITAKLKDEAGTTEVADLEAKIVYSAIEGKNTASETFEAGYSYDITVYVYGLEPVEILATVAEWKDGGSGVIDPEDNL